MKKEQEGWWLVYKAPVKDDKGWFIQTENTKTKDVGREDYNSEVEAKAAYLELVLNAVHKRTKQ